MKKVTLNLTDRQSQLIGDAILHYKRTISGTRDVLYPSQDALDAVHNLMDELQDILHEVNNAPETDE